MKTFKSILDVDRSDLTFERLKYLLEGSDISQTYSQIFGKLPGMSGGFGDGYQNIMILSLFRKIQELEGFICDLENRISNLE